MRYLAAEYGIRQFLDIGTGLPTAANTHEVAQAVAPECRIVYVDNDPVVLLHARSRLVGDPAARPGYVEADLRDTGRVLAEAARTLDFSQPVAVLLLLILHLIPDSDDPYGIVGPADGRHGTGQLPGADPRGRGYRGRGHGRDGQVPQPAAGPEGHDAH